MEDEGTECGMEPERRGEEGDGWMDGGMDDGRNDESTGEGSVQL